MPAQPRSCPLRIARPMVRTMRMQAIFAAMLATLVTGCAGYQLQPTPRPEFELRDLTEAEKKIIAAGVAKSLADAKPAQFRWTKFPKDKDGVVKYCATVNAQRFVADVTIVNGQAASAQVEASGGSGGFVDVQCRRHYVNPFS
jgi:hypothetical protein